MSNRLHKVNIEGYGEVTLRSLTKKQLERNASRFEDENERLVQILRLGMADPKLTDEFLESVRSTPDVLGEISHQILLHSWPNVSI